MYKKVWLLNHLTDTKKKLRGHSYRLLKHLPKGLHGTPGSKTAIRQKKLTITYRTVRKENPWAPGFPLPSSLDPTLLCP